jgi:hypothetical protein
LYSLFAERRYVNPGRLANSYTLLQTAWELLTCDKSPIADVCREFNETFQASLDEIADEQGSMATEETEAERFIRCLNALICSRPDILHQADGITQYQNKNTIGKWCDDGLFIIPEIALPEMVKLQMFSQIPTVDSMSKALDAAGYLIKIRKGRRLVQRRFRNTPTRGWLIPTEVIMRNSQDEDSNYRDDRIQDDNNYIQPLGTLKRYLPTPVTDEVSVAAKHERYIESRLKSSNDPIDVTPVTVVTTTNNTNNNTSTPTYSSITDIGTNPITSTKPMGYTNKTDLILSSALWLEAQSGDPRDRQLTKKRS